MAWDVVIADEFRIELDSLSPSVQTELAASAKMLAEFGPSLGRPKVDTLNGSHYANMKELRFDADGGTWRIAFAFDPRRKAILLVAGDKSGGSQQRFYKELIRKADTCFARHLSQIPKGGTKDVKEP